VRGVTALTASVFSFLNPLTDIERSIGDAIAKALAALGSALANNTSVTIGTRYSELLRTDAVLAAFVGAGVLLFAAARAALSGDAARLGHDVIRVLLGVVSGFLLLALIPLVETAVHAMASAVASTFTGSATDLTSGLAAALVGTGVAAWFTGVGFFLAVILGGVLLVVVLILYATLILAQAVAYIAAFFVPLAVVLSPRLGRKVLELLVVALATPFLIVSILAVGIAVFGDGPNAGTTLEHVIAGGGIIAVGCFSPLFAHRAFQGGAAVLTNARHPHEAAARAAGTATKAAAVPASGGSPLAASGGPSAAGAAGRAAAGAAASGAPPAAAALAATVAARRARRAAAPRSATPERAAGSSTARGVSAAVAPGNPTSGAIQPPGRASSAPTGSPGTGQPAASRAAQPPRSAEAAGGQGGEA
jgi:hypothetical protein